MKNVMSGWEQFTRREINEWREALQAALDRLDAREQELDEIDPVYELAGALHRLLCTWNHTDGCGWFYALNDWKEYSHANYLEKARTVMAALPDKSVEEIIQIVSALK